MKNRPVVVPLDEEEADLAESLESLIDRPASLLTPEARTEIEAMARSAIGSDFQEISIKLSRSDLAILKSRAQKEGVPYSTLISDLIHKYVSN